jgi:hypothetical protein
MSNRSAVIIALVTGVILVGGSVMLFLVGWGIGVVIERSRNTHVHTKQELLTELNQILPPPGAEAIDRDRVTIKSGHALVGRNYSFNGTYEDIRNHYDMELRSRGWQFVEESKLKNWSQDFGERDLSYCKEGMWVAVFYNGRLASKRGYLYEVNVSSGLNECK